MRQINQQARKHCLLGLHQRPHFIRIKINKDDIPADKAPVKNINGI
ncbi:hypothetical protein XBP1_2820001 [Xenorhabdus bovienii str. puntauvense]|uniref:Uncharacterized protein n=2 Tax=Xenorhabdus bovienii TaxID=40576 RepID=A0A077NH89_XENBV|nr:hypothetical protein XBP1_2820001 [Xenorhabdus bovienii str. puntauvense]CDH23402.1 hypothetical protein XBKB1_1790004 [Xenorhabdus bovienii str. kraussei Becker Underwood]